MDIIGSQPFVDTLQLRRERLRIARRSIAAHQVALHAVVVVRDDLHRPVEVPRMGLLGRGDRTLIESLVVDVGVVGAVDCREVIHERCGLRRIEVELRHAEHGRRTDRLRVEQEFVQPARLHLLPLADERRRQPAPRVVRLDVGIDLLLVGDHDGKQQPGQIAAAGRVVRSGLHGIGGHVDVLTAHEPRLAVNQRIVPEHDRLMGRRLGIPLFDRNAVFVDQLGLASDRIERGHAEQRCVPATLAIGHERLRDILRGEVGGQKRVVGHGRSLAQRAWLIPHVPTIHLQAVATTAIVLLSHLESGDPRLFAGRRLVDELRCRRLRHQPQDKRHDSLTLLVVERELRHAVAFVIALVFRLLVVVAAGGAELLPEEALTLVGHQLLEEEAGRGIDRFRREMLDGGGRIGQIRRQRLVLWNGMLRTGMRSRWVGMAIAGRCVISGPVPMPVLVGELMHHKMRHLLEGDLRRILAAPVGECRTSGLRIFETRDVVARRAGQFCERLFTNVVEQRGITVCGRHAQQHLFVADYLGLVRTETIGENLLRPRGGEAVLEIHQGQFVEGLPLVGRERVGGRDLLGLPVFRRSQQIGRGVGGGIAHLAIGQRHGLEQHVRHEGARMVAGRVAKPAVEPCRAPRIRGHLGTDPRQVRPMRARRFGEVRMLMAGQAAADLEHLLAPLDVGEGRDARVGLHVVKGLTRILQVGDHRADFEWLVPHRLLESLALEVLPQSEEPRHLGGGTEVLRVPQPGIEPIEPHLAGDVPERRANLRQRARGLGILEERGELMAAGRKLGVVTSDRIALDHLAETIPRLAAVRARTNILDPADCGGAERGQTGIGGEGFGHLVVVGRQPHVRADPLVGPRPAVDLVASVAAVLADQVITFDELRGGRLGKPLARLEIDHLMVAFQAARLLEPLRQHRIDPMVVVEPAMFVMPFMPLLGRVWRVR